MTAITNARSIIEVLVGHNITNDALIRIADAYVIEDPYNFVGNGDIVFIDPENPTSEEKARLFLMTLKKSGQIIVQRVAGKKSDESSAITKAAAVAAAIADFE